VEPGLLDEGLDALLVGQIIDGPEGPLDVGPDPLRQRLVLLVDQADLRLPQGVPEEVLEQAPAVEELLEELVGDVAEETTGGVLAAHRTTRFPRLFIRSLMCPPFLKTLQLDHPLT
jgi:hypothetical protein